MASGSVYIAVIGAGGVGSVFISQLANLAKSYPRLSLVLVSRSRKHLKVSDFAQTLSFETWARDLEASQEPAITPAQILEFLKSAPGKCVIADNTSDQSVAESYPSFLKHGISIVTPNKKAFGGSWSLWQDVFAAAHSSSNPSGGFVYHESSVGAGLPVISTLKDLVETGDDVTRIEGSVSGTLSFLFNSFAPVSGNGGKWSAEVKKAKELGYTEPDPRDDLGGMDVARKMTILARLAGIEVEGTSAFPVQSLIPKALEDVKSGDEFVERLPEFDDEMDKLREEAQAQGKVVRYIGSIDVAKKEVKVGLRYEDKDSPIAALKGSENMFNFYTRRYGERPLIIQGPGAGAEITAMGVTGDLIKVLQRLQ